MIYWLLGNTLTYSQDLIHIAQNSLYQEQFQKIFQNFDQSWTSRLDIWSGDFFQEASSHKAFAM